MKSIRGVRAEAVADTRYCLLFQAGFAFCHDREGYYTLLGKARARTASCPVLKDRAAKFGLTFLRLHSSLDWR